jgi:hypothetical protein
MRLAQGLTSVKVSKKNSGLMNTKPSVMAEGTQPAMKYPNTVPGKEINQHGKPKPMK